MRDFTVQTYISLCSALKEENYSFITFLEYCKGEVTDRFVIMRHDVDRSPLDALRIANCEKDLDVRSSFYFRMTGSSYDPSIIMQIRALGHEIGYHYEDLSSARGNFDDAIASFAEHLNTLRGICPIKTISMHGGPLSKWDNRLLWSHYDYRDYGILGEPYLDVDFSKISYLTDTGRHWNNNEVSVRDKVDTAEHYRFRWTVDIIDALRRKQLAHRIMFNIHPQRWHDDIPAWLKELVWQSCKNVAKRCLLVKK